MGVISTVVRRVLCIGRVTTTGFTWIRRRCARYVIAITSTMNGSVLGRGIANAANISYELRASSLELNINNESVETLEPKVSSYEL